MKKNGKDAMNQYNEAKVLNLRLLVHILIILIIIG